MDKTMCELFAGVGGFRVGMERLNSGWDTVWFSQWEPGRKRQDAHDCYVSHFGDCKDLNGEYTTGIDIHQVDKKAIPDHTLLAAGFPCQSYSVARPASSSQGIEGEKGVLWWDIRDTLIEKRPPFVLLENVDRLLKSPAKQRGRDFGIILSCLWQLNYMVEWRVINGADYGCPQRRRRTFIFAAHQSTNYYKEMMRRDRKDVFLKEGFFARSFPISSLCEIDEVSLPADLVECSNSFAFPFQNTGWMESGTVYTAKTEPVKEDPVLLKDILESDVDDKYYITPEKMEKWEYLKSAKKLERINKQTGFAYTYSEGPVPFPDSWEKPARTILTSESSVSRTSHAVIDPITGAYRVLTPVEVERIQTFPDNWTNTGMSERFRYFCMGNALITTLITRMGKVLDEIIEKE